MPPRDDTKPRPTATSRGKVGASRKPSSDALDRDASRGEYVYKKLREAISDGTFKSGERIREEDVAKMLDVSRTPVREAIRRLQARGILVQAQGAGVVVAELSNQQLQELYAFRALLEGAAARLAAQHVSTAEIETLRFLLSEFGANLHNPARLARVNQAFHSTINDAAHNQYLLDSLNGMTDALALLRDTTFSVAGRPAIALQEHEAIVDAIERRDPDAAEAAARRHIVEAQRARMQMLLYR
jgi:DNA-binding GntR family transcriptional regulator